MKYYLIIGYQVFEKNKGYPVVSIYLNGNLLYQFDCDNEKSKEVSICEELNVKDHYPCYNRNISWNRVHKYSCPAKHKLIELDSSTWSESNKLLVEVSNNNSNYTNGFMSKRSMVCISPVFLIRKDILEDRSVLRGMMEKSHKAKFRTKYPVADTAPIWPGISQHPDTDNGRYMNQGGNFKMHFDIIKKHKTYVLVKDGTIPKGYFIIDRFSTAWLQHYNSKHFDFVANIVNTNNTDNDAFVIHDINVELREKLKE